MVKFAPDISTQLTKLPPVDEENQITVKMVVTGDFNTEKKRNFSSVEDLNNAIFKIEKLRANSVIDVNITINAKEKVYYVGTVKNVKIESGINTLDLYLESQSVMDVLYTYEVNDFINALILPGSTNSVVEIITANSDKPGITLSEDGKTVNIYNVALTGSFTSSYHFPESLLKANLSGINTTEVTSMAYMFFNCHNLSELNISTLDTSNVTTMCMMFSLCNGLSSLDLTNFDTSKVENMEYMFSNCAALSTLNVSSFNTSKVTDMKKMFGECGNLTELDLSNFDTAKNEQFNIMFSGCKSLKTIYASNLFKLTSSKNSTNMFNDCTSLKGEIAYDATKTDGTYANFAGYFTDKNGHLHVWDDGVITVVPTSTTTGEKIYTCGICGVTRKEVLSPTIIFGGENFDYATANIGDLVLTDGSIISPDEYIRPVAVIIKEASNDEPALGVGINLGKGYWAGTGSLGYEKNIAALQKQNLTDPKEAFNILKQECSDVETNPELYSAWYYAYNYGQNNNFENYKDGWYLPSKSELSSLYYNKEILEKSLINVCGFKIEESTSTIYLTCNQYASTATSIENVWIQKYSDNGTSNTKSSPYRVCAVREFETLSAKVGDVVLSNGAVIDSENYNKAMAVIFRKQNGNTPALGVGVKYSDTALSFITDSSKAMYELAGTKTTGYMDGSDSLDIYRNYYTITDSNANSVSWDYIAKYGESFQFRKYRNGWYFPTISELNILYGAIGKVDETFAKVGIKKLSENDTPFWSCNQISTSSWDKVYRMNFSTGEIDYQNQYNTSYKSMVLTIHQFGGNPLPKQLEVTSLPNKTKFYFDEEESIDLTGMKIKAYFADGSESDVTSSVVVKGFSSTIESPDTGITLEYTKNGKTVSIIVPVTVEYKYHCENSNCGQGYNTETEALNCLKKFNCPGFEFVEINGFEDGTFYIGKTEITNAKWNEVYEWATSDERTKKYKFSSGSSLEENKNKPVGSITRNDALVWCNAASEKEGLTPFYYNAVGYLLTDSSASIIEVCIKQDANGYRLPYNVEWEYAAKGGESYNYAGSDILSEVAWYIDNAAGEIHETSKLKPNGYGIYDIYGNVSEWCHYGHNTLNYYSNGGSANSSEDSCGLTQIIDNTSNKYQGLRIVRQISTTYGTNIATRNYDYSTAKVGDIIMKDGSIVSPANYDRNSSGINAPVAVIFRAKTDDAPALGLALSYGTDTAWCSKTSEGFDRAVTKLNATLADDNTVTTDLTSGKNSYQLLKTSLTDAGNNNGTYKAWYFADRYASQRGFSVLTTGWYLPTITELSELYQVSKLSEFTNGLKKASPAFLNSKILSCSQDSSVEKNIFCLDFSSESTGIPESIQKDTGLKVIAIREFN